MLKVLSVEKAKMAALLMERIAMTFSEMRMKKDSLALRLSCLIRSRTAQMTLRRVMGVKTHC